MRPLTVGLTGGIGSGKSVVADLFAGLGVPVIDADRLARRLVEPGRPSYRAVVGRFGSDAVRADGLPDRTWLRQHILADGEAKVWLERLLHPKIRRFMRREIARCAYPYCVLAIPLLIETWPHPLVRRVLVVDAPVDLRRQRVQCRDGLPAAAVDKMLAVQADRQSRLRLADDVIDNDGDLMRLAADVTRLHGYYLCLAHHGLDGAVHLQRS